MAGSSLDQNNPAGSATLSAPSRIRACNCSVSPTGSCAASGLTSMEAISMEVGAVEASQAASAPSNSAAVRTRFVTMALHDKGVIPFEEPFATFRKHGLLIKEGSKMSKSRGNVVIPDRYIEEWGADTFRTYLMFLGPYQEGGDFRDSGLQGPFRFLSALWNSIVPVDQLGEGIVFPIELLFCDPGNKLST